MSRKFSDFFGCFVSLIVIGILGCLIAGFFGGFGEYTQTILWQILGILLSLPLLYWFIKTVLLESIIFPILEWFHSHEMVLLGITAVGCFLSTLLPQPWGLGVTVFFILSIFFYSMYWLVTQGKIIISMNLIQPLLFTWLYYQIFANLGAEYYKYEQLPEWKDWLQFTFIHILRASDFLDILDEYQIHLQNIQHHRWEVAGVIVAMHWMVDVFLITVVVNFFLRKPTAWLAKYSRFFNILLQISLIIVIIALIKMAISQHWSWQNACVWWPLDNFLRVLDAGDAFQLFNWRLHTIPSNTWNSILTIAFRIVIAGYITKYGTKIRLYSIGGRGLAVEELIENLQDSNPKIYQASANTLQKMSSIAAVLENNASLEQIIALLSHEDSKIRKSAGTAIWEMNQRKLDDIHQLVRALPLNWDAINYALGKIDPQWSISESAQAAIPDLITTLIHEKSSEARKYSALALAKLISEKNNLSSHGNNVPISENVAVVSALIQSLKNDSDIYVRAAAAEALGIMKASSSEVELIFVLQNVNENHNVLEAAAEALGNMKSAKAVPALIQSLPHTFKAGPIALGKIGSASQDAILELVKYLSSTYYRVYAQEALDKISPNWRTSEQAKLAIPVLIEQLQHTFPDIQQNAALALAELGPIAQSAIPALLLKLQDDPVIQNAAVIAFSKMGDAGVPALFQSLSHPNDKVREFTANALAEMGIMAESFVPVLIQTLADSSWTVRNAAANALNKIFPEWATSEIAQTALVKFIKGLTDLNSNVRRSFAEALGKFGPQAVIAIPALIQSISDPESDVRQSAIQALGQIGLAAKSAIPALQIATKDSSVFVRESAKEVLYKIKHSQVK